MRARIDWLVRFAAPIVVVVVIIIIVVVVVVVAVIIVISTMLRCAVRPSPQSTRNDLATSEKDQTFKTTTTSTERVIDSFDTHRLCPSQDWRVLWLKVDRLRGTYENFNIAALKTSQNKNNLQHVTIERRRRPLTPIAVMSIAFALRSAIDMSPPPAIVAASSTASRLSCERRRTLRMLA